MSAVFSDYKINILNECSQNDPSIQTLYGMEP